MAGINSGVINFVYDYVEHEDRATAMGVKSAIGGILSFLTALLSGAVLSKIQENGGLLFFGITVYAQQLLSLFSVVAVIALIVYMRLIIAPLQRVEEIENGDCRAMIEAIMAKPLEEIKELYNTREIEK